MRTLQLFNSEKAVVLSFVKIVEPKNKERKIVTAAHPNVDFLHCDLLNLLVSISFCYLLLPVVIFVLGFVRIELSGILIGLMAIVFYRLIRNSIAPGDLKMQTKNRRSEWRAWRWHLLLMSVLVLGWLSLSSIGGIGYRNFDSGIRSSLLWHLVTGSWPLYFGAGYFGTEFGAIQDKAYVYYFGYYLPAAVMGKLLGWKAANLSLFAYSWLGTLLALMLVRLCMQGRQYWVTIMVFAGICLFGGMDYIFNALFDVTADRSEMWLSPFHYFSHTRNLFWSPQHCLPTWLIIGVILNGRKVNPLLMRIFPLVTVSMLLWSPLCLIGIAPFLFTVIKYHWKQWLRLSFENILTCLLFLLLTAFIVSNDFSFQMLFAPDVVAGFWKQYSAFVITEFAILSAILLFQSHQTIEHSIIIAIGLLLVIPFVILGQWNDWSIKVSMPPLFMLSVFIIKQIILLIENKKTTVWIPVLLFSICTLTPLEELVYSAKNWRISFEIPPEIREFGPNYIVWQQLGDPGSFFFHYIARRQEQQKRPPVGNGQPHASV